MIRYDPGNYSLSFAFSLRGSVFPKAFMMAMPCSLLSMGVHVLFDHLEMDNEAIGDAGTTVLSGFSFILGFLVVFRSQQAYSRWWEGGTLLQQLRGEWFNAFSSLVAFCNAAPDKAEDVAKFQHQLARLMSLLYGAALNRVGTVSDKTFEVIDLDGLDVDSIMFMQESHDCCEVVLQWVQRLVVEADEAKILKIAPPILSRVFNQLGNGIVNLNNAQKITDFPIPFPLSQMITIMLLVHLVSTAIVCATAVESVYWTGILSFIVIMSYWSINFIAVELEMPFGDDANDLPIYDMQMDLNLSLKGLLCNKMATSPPAYDFEENYASEMHFRILDFDKRLDEQCGQDVVVSSRASEAPLRHANKARLTMLEHPSDSGCIKNRQSVTDAKAEEKQMKVLPHGRQEKQDLTTVALEDVVLFTAPASPEPAKKASDKPPDELDQPKTGPHEGERKAAVTAAVTAALVGKTMEPCTHPPPTLELPSDAPPTVQDFSAFMPKAVRLSSHATYSSEASATQCQESTCILAAGSSSLSRALQENGSKLVSSTLASDRQVVTVHADAPEEPGNPISVPETLVLNRQVVTVHTDAPEEAGNPISVPETLILNRQVEQHLSNVVTELQCMSDRYQQMFNLHCDFYGLLCALFEKMPLPSSLVGSAQGSASAESSRSLSPTKVSWPV